MQLLTSHAGLSQQELSSLQLAQPTCAWDQGTRAPAHDYASASEVPYQGTSHSSPREDSGARHLLARQQQQQQQQQSMFGFRDVAVALADSGHEGGEPAQQQAASRPGRQLLAAAAGALAAPACPANVTCQLNASSVFAGQTAAGQVVAQGCTQVSHLETVGLEWSFSTHRRRIPGSLPAISACCGLACQLQLLLPVGLCLSSVQ